MSQHRQGRRFFRIFFRYFSSEASNPLSISYTWDHASTHKLDYGEHIAMASAYMLVEY